MSLHLRGYEERSLIERSIRKFDFYLVTISKERVLMLDPSALNLLRDELAWKW